MVCLERWFGSFVILVLYLAVHHCVMIQPKTVVENSTEISDGLKNKSTAGVPFCAQNTTQPVSNSTVNSQIPSNSCVPVVFPQKGINGENIRTTNGTFQASSVKSDAATPSNQTELSSNSTNNSVILNCNNTNVNATNVKSTSKVSDGNATNFNPTATTNVSAAAVDTKAEIVANSTVPDENAFLVEDENNTTLTQNVTNVNTLNAPPNNSNATLTNSNKTDTEVPDMMVHPTRLDDKISESSSHVSYSPEQSVNKETELIENGQNTEDILRNSSLHEDKLSRAGVPLVQGQLAAILAGVFVVISITAYVGLLSWRRYLENRYGTRQMLVNEDEFNDDMRHFSI